MDRTIGRFRAPHPGSVTGIAVNVDNPRTAGLLQVTVLKNTGNAGAVGSPMPFVAVIDMTPPLNKRVVTQPQDVTGCTFNAGDELFLGIGYSGWNVGGLASAVYAAIEIET